MGRGIKDRPNIESKDIIINKAIIYPDIEINKSKFKVQTKIVDGIIMNLQYDESDNVVATYDVGKFYKRNIYFSISNDGDINYDDVIRSLSLRAYKVFTYIKKNIKVNSNYIILSTENILSIIGDKYKSNAYAVIRELTDKKVLYKSKEAEYKDVLIINHNLFFKGSYSKFCYKYNKVYDNIDDEI